MRASSRGRPEGHLDLARMRQGGIRGGIFSIFTPSEGEEHDPVPREDGVVRVPVCAAGFVSGCRRLRECGGGAAAGARGFRLRRALPAGSPTSTPPCVTTVRRWRVLHLEGAEAIDPRLEAPAAVVRRGLALARAGVEPGQRLRPRRPVHLAVVARHRPGFERRRASPWSAPAPSSGILVDLSHLNEAGFWDMARLDARTAGGEPFRRPRPLPGLAQPHRRRSSTRSGHPAGWWGSSSPARSCGGMVLMTPTPRSI